MSGPCQVGDPKASLSVTFKTASGKSETKPIVTLKIPGSVRHGIETVCKKAVGGTNGIAASAKDVVVAGAEKVDSAVKSGTTEMQKTFKAVRQLRPQDIPQDYREAIYEKLQSAAANGSKETPDPAGYRTLGDFGLIDRAAKWAGWFQFGEKTELGAVFFVNQHNRVEGVVGTIKIKLK